jgi:hypothetical protein
LFGIGTFSIASLEANESANPNNIPAPREPIGL